MGACGSKPKTLDGEAPAKKPVAETPVVERVLKKQEAEASSAPVEAPKESVVDEVAEVTEVAEVAEPKTEEAAVEVAAPVEKVPAKAEGEDVPVVVTEFEKVEEVPITQASKESEETVAA